MHIEAEVIQTLGTRLPNGYWTFERCLEAARPFASKTAFSAGNNKAYCAAKRAGWLQKIYAELGMPGERYGYMTEEYLIKEGRKYNTVKAFREGNPTAYAMTHSRGENAGAIIPPMKRPICLVAWPD